MYFPIFISFIILQRILELLLSADNEKWLRARGAVEYGRGHYPFVFLLHSLFLTSLIAEYLVGNTPPPSKPFAGIYFLLLILKIWTITSLGKYWNTKILRIPNAPPVTKGPYRYIQHPNYWIVAGEILVIPMVFGWYAIALLFTILNAMWLTIRIREENRAWHHTPRR
jgi:methyltransferase